MSTLRIAPAGDAALLAEWPPRIDPVLNGRAVALGRALARHRTDLRDVVVGYASVTLYFDPLVTDAASLQADIVALEADLADAVATEGRLHEIQVSYGGADGPDLPEVADAAGMTEREVIARHTAVTYRVYMLGFMPGFAYMAPLDPRIVAGRRAVPRARVPAGSVAIAAGQTGIYPVETPGGWQIIGRTTVKPFDPDRADPFLFEAGDRVRFHPADRA